LYIAQFDIQEYPLTNFIPLVDLSAQFTPLKKEIFQAWADVLDGMQLFLGPNVRTFETEFARYCGVEHAIGVSDGTTALQLALRACGVGPGDEVITVSHTFIATVEAIRLVGARPVFVDIDPRTYTMDVNQIRSRISKHTRVILPVHLYGHCADMDPILEIAQKHGLDVIEDACQAHGATYKDRKAGSMGRVAAFSFYFSKNLGGYGEGGMVTTGDEMLSRRIQMLRDHGSEQKYEHSMVGINGRLDELQAAVLRIKLRRLDEWNARRRANAEHYQKALEHMDVVPPVETIESRHIFHLYVIRVRQRDALRAWLNQRGIGTGIHYPIPVHLQKPYYKYGTGLGSLPMTEAAARKIISLPMYPELTFEQIDQVISQIEAFLAQN
jgi:dTDP-4-amino-4,6-dideoxygalactose transaminase